MALAEKLANRRWLRREKPFPHVVATDVFTPAAYRDIEVAFQQLLALGLGDPRERERFSRSIEGYDVYALSLQPSLPEPLHVFFSREWHDAIAAVAGGHATGDVDGALHHHPPGTLSGRPHNDLNPGWFAGEADPGEVNLSDGRRCSYQSGRLGAAGVGGPSPRETIRAVAVLFYVNNPPWRPGDGGETGLYLDGRARTENPVLAVPPRNNSLLLFECTPRSYHAFIRNTVQPRNSVIHWLHRTKEDVIRRWGSEPIVSWDGPRVLNEAS